VPRAAAEGEQSRRRRRLRPP